MKRVLVPVPSYGFDPTEAAVPWHCLRQAGHHLTFATPDGAPAQADERMLTGMELPALFKSSLMARADAVACYRELENAPEFRSPISYAASQEAAFDALLLPGGHDKGMRPYLESAVLQARVSAFFLANKPVAAICHGTLLAARSLSGEHSVLWGRKTTGLTRRQELFAWRLTRARLGDYYRTYETPMMDELVSRLRSASDYSAGPGFPIPLTRDSKQRRNGFTVRDANYVSARWPGDAWTFAQVFLELLQQA